MVTANHFASTNRVQLRYIPEASWGTTPVTGNGINLRMTGESLDWTLTKQSDKEIRSDRQLSSTTTVDAQAAGDVKIHMQYAEYDKLFAALLQDTWTAFGTNGVGVTFTADYTATTITASVATSGTSIFTALKKGQWFLLRTGGANDKKLLRVSTSVAPSSTVITLDASTPATIASAVTGCFLETSRLTNGVTMPSFTLEKSMGDVTQFLAYQGMCVSKFTTSFAAAALTEGTFTFLGKSATRAAVTTLPGSPVASQTYDIENAVSGVGQVWEGGAPITTTSIMKIDITIDNALRPQKAIGTLGLAGIGVGTFSVKGNVDIYFADGSIYDKFLADVYTSFTFSTQDTAGNGYVFTLPKVMLTSGKIQAGAKDTDLMATFTYECYADTGNADATLRQTLFMDRIGVAVLP